MTPQKTAGVKMFLQIYAGFTCSGSSKALKSGGIALASILNASDSGP